MTLAHLKTDDPRTPDKPLAVLQSPPSTACASRLGRWRHLQFSIRDLLVLMLVVSVVCSLARTWWTSRLVYLVEAYNESLDEGEYERAIGLAEKAAWLYSDDPVAKAMFCEARCIRKVQEDKELSADEAEYLGYEHADGAPNRGVPSVDKEWEYFVVARRTKDAKRDETAAHKPP
jgi:hypothetical protein